LERTANRGLSRSSAPPHTSFHPSPTPTNNQKQENLVSEIERLAALRRADGAPEPSAQPASQNPLQGALSEARLITWPRPQKALLDTALVLGIVAGTSALVFGLNVVLAELATAWYKSH
jgi:preprotein translocase SecE subunit